MLVEAGSVEYVFVPVEGPEGLDLSLITGEIAVFPEDQAHPVTGDWHAGSWVIVQGSLAYLLDTTGMAAGSYLVKVRLTSGSEHVILHAGRLRVG